MEKRRSTALPAAFFSPAATERVKRARIGLVDDHPLMRAGLIQLLNQQPDMTVCFEAAEPGPVLRLVDLHRPDLVITDLTMPGGNGLEMLKQLKQQNPALRVLVFSMHDETIYAERVLRNGADGYIMKDHGGELLLAAIRRVMQGQTFLTDRMWSQLVTGMSGRRGRQRQSPMEKLTDREFQVLELIGQGRSTREIAEHLHISPKTVDVHRGRLRQKLDLRDATALMRYAVRWTEVMSV